MTTEQIRAIAIYLPQFHPIPENDEWWEKGFTEWSNVTKTTPRCKGHYQPHLPIDLGFYDLRLPEAREAQAELARKYGIHGFCYYHYWFGGRRLLEKPFAEVLNSGKPDFPFCLCWANETWNRRWDGQEKEVLIKQIYSEEDDRNHIRWLCAAFRDDRYIRVEGRPLFLVYRFSQLPDPARTLDLWRKEARLNGIGDIFVCNVESNFASERGLASQYDLDAAVEFAPDSTMKPPRMKPNWLTPLLKPFPDAQHYASKFRLTQPWLLRDDFHSYEGMVNAVLAKEQPDYIRFPCVTPGWDNTSRREWGATIFVGNTPEIYKRWLQAAIRKSKTANPSDPMVFINAWNEWAEGNHLEPCRRWKYSFLEATRDALAAEKETNSEQRQSSTVRPVSTVN